MAEALSWEAWQAKVERQLSKMPDNAKELREAAKNNLWTFACLVNPGYMYGRIHKEVYDWLEEYTLYSNEDVTSNKLIMLPRAHLKSHMVATWCAWMITRHPEITILYVSATSSLAETQLYAIKNILTSRVYTKFFPEYIHPFEGKRERWNSTNISVDHIKRREESVRDDTISTAGLTTNTTGWHSDVIVSDDIVVPENAYTEQGRSDVSKKASQFTSIRNPGGFTLACGTRYHPNDVYSEWKGMKSEVYNDEDEVVDIVPVWEIKEFAVEQEGQFIWPRVVRPEDGKVFGFNRNVLARIKSEYTDRTQFYAQYYNDPNAAGSNRITRDKFQYYNPRYLKRLNGTWYYKNRKLNIFAAIDFAFSLGKKADYTVLLCIGVDCERNIYVLDIDRFKSDKTLDYFNSIRNMHSRWNFKKLSAEVTVAQKVIVNSVKEYLREYGLTLKIEEYRPSAKEGSKEERIAAILEPKYDEMKVYHGEGGFFPTLEEELIQARPKNDDVKDALASAVSISNPPKQFLEESRRENNIVFNSRFGGVSYR